jgi:hypothetical protein
MFKTSLSFDIRLATMTEQAINQLAAIAADTAMRGAADYFRLNDITVTNFVRATDLIRAEVRSSLDEALDDAKSAFGCGMDRMATCTFRASMLAAGLRAAKAYVEVN